MLNLTVQAFAELCWARGVADRVKACLSIQLELSSSPWSDSGPSEEADDVFACVWDWTRRAIFTEIINISLLCVVTLLKLDIIS